MSKPEKMPMKRPEINIKIADVGYIVTVGCKTFACDDYKKVMAELGSYLKGEYTTLTSQYKKELTPHVPVWISTESITAGSTITSGNIT